MKCWPHCERGACRSGRRQHDQVRTSQNWSGFIRKDGDGIHVSIRDTLGWVMTFRGVRRTNDEGQPGYILGEPVHTIPASLRIPFIDDEEVPK
jgi:hypothetical protein